MGSEHSASSLGPEHAACSVSVIPLKCDIGIQWPDGQPAEHNYSSVRSSQDSTTQTDHKPSLSVNDLDDKDSRFYSGIGIDG